MGDAEPAPPSAATKCPLRFSWGGLITAVASGYICVCAFNLAKLANPMWGVEVLPDEATVDPLWKQGTRVSLQAYLTGSAQFRAAYLNRSDPAALALAPLVGEASDLDYSHNMASTSFDLRFVMPNDSLFSSSAAEATKQAAAAAKRKGKADTANVTVLDPRLWQSLHGNRTVFLHMLLAADGAPVDPAAAGYDELRAMHLVVPLVKHGTRRPAPPLRRLLHESGAAVRAAHAALEATLPSHIAFWAEEATVRLVADWTRYPLDGMPLAVAHALDWLAVGTDGRPVQQNRQQSGRRRNRDKSGERVVYRPTVHVSRVGTDKYIPLNASATELPLRLTVESMSLQRWQLMTGLGQALDSQKELFGFSDKDIDEVRSLVTETNVVLLCVTLLASTLHLIFEFLAFRADVSFWRGNKSIAGLSGRTVGMELLFQTVILLDLIQEDASLLVTIPSAVGVAIQAWKLRRALSMMRGVRLAKATAASGDSAKTVAKNRVSVSPHGAAASANVAAAWSASPTTGKVQKRKNAAAKAAAAAAAAENGNAAGAAPPADNGSAAAPASVCPFALRLPADKLVGLVSPHGASAGAAAAATTAAAEVKGAGGIAPEAAAAAADESLSVEADRTAVLHLGAVLLPAVVGYSAKLLLLGRHASWYGWAVSSATGFVYAAGFAMMTPQLWINYKLRSVAHMPWRFMCYRFLNTFIDDLFAFVIKMPTVHRLSCFRDDVVFFIFLYQRWIYPVDKTRVNEFGTAAAEAPAPAEEAAAPAAVVPAAAAADTAATARKAPADAGPSPSKRTVAAALTADARPQGAR